ncbi:MAG: ATP-binding protein [Phascolarctobacterium sp.]|nr:ATP-binding protein [Phascolarctobacterium sp.]
MLERTNYIEQLWTWKDEQVIKVITGIRRSGKSTLLKQYQDRLISNGIKKEQIVYINFEEIENEHLLDYHTLHDYLKSFLGNDKMTYIFLDEIQKVPDFEKTVDSIYVKPNVDIYITGSNSYFLSSDLATLLSGRYIEIPILPFSFAEYVQLNPSKDKNELFAEYLEYGGFPYLASMEKTPVKADVYLEGIYNTVIVHDIEERARLNKQYDKRKINDIILLKTIARYLVSVIGSQVSTKKIADYLKSNLRAISPNTVNDYIEALAEAFVFYKAERYDIAGKQLLKQNSKWYVVDIGLRNHILPKQHYDLGFTLENIVYLELLRRNYRLNVGKFNATEIDFVAEKNGIFEYYQVTADMTAEATFTREITPLQSLKDNYDKIVLTLDRFSLGNYNGVKVVNIIDWLLSAT